MIYGLNNKHLEQSTRNITLIKVYAQSNKVLVKLNKLINKRIMLD